MKYESEVEIGHVYRDVQTGFQGVAVIVEFHQHGCTRIVLESAGKDNDLKAYAFDEVRLEPVGEKAKTSEKQLVGAGRPGAASSDRSRPLR